MMWRTCRRGVGAVVCAAVLSSGCVSLDGRAEDVVMDVFMAVFANAGPRAISVAAAKKEKLSAELTVPTEVSIGGLSGTYDVTLGTYGGFSGTATIVGQKAAKLTDDGSAELLAAVGAIVADALATDVTVATAKAKITGRQTTGGIKKKYKGKITFAGTVASGPSAGSAVKGKIATKGDLED
jgi:hypothetical protein